MDMSQIMGVIMLEQIPTISMSTLITNDMAREKDPEQHPAIRDYDYGAYVAFLAGSIIVKVREMLLYCIV